MMIAIYGTLRYTEWYRKFIKSGMTFRGHAFIGATMYDLGAFPGIKLGKGTTTVELWELPQGKEEEIISRLDAYEGYREGDDNSLYIRTEVPIRMAESPMPEMVTIYEYNQSTDGFPVVPQGDWMQWRDSLSLSPNITMN